jgi:hypothetical protein
MHGEELDFPEEVLWHLYSLMLMDRMSGNYARFEYLDHFSIIDHLNQRPKVYYVFTSHPTQPNSLIQLVAATRMLKGIEENDFVYLKFAAKLLLQGNKLRLFNVYIIMYSENLIPRGVINIPFRVLASHDRSHCYGLRVRI